MDKEQIRQGLEKKLKGLNVPQEDIDKALLDFDTLANEINDPKALERFGEQLVENVSYKNNIAPDDGIEEYRKLFPEQWGVEPPSDKDIEDFLNEEIKKEYSVEDAVDDGWPPEDPWDTSEGPTEDDINKRFGQDAPTEEDLMYQASDEEFDKIIDNEKRANWWRYDGSGPEEQDFMERYTTGDLTDEELADLRSQHEDFAKDVDEYDKQVDAAADANGITDKQSWKNLVMAGTKLLQLVDEEIIYVPAVLAQKGLAALGIPGAALAGKGINLALMYEDFLFKANVGIAALAHGSVALEGAIERAPELPQKISNAVLGLYGMGMPQGLVPQQETPISDASKEAQAAKHKEYFYNQMYQYSRMSPSLRLFTDVIGPKTGMYEQIDVLKKVANMGKNKPTETRPYNQFGVND